MLYDEYVEDLREFLRSHGPYTPVVLVQSARIVPDCQVLFGHVGLEAVKDISRVLFNPGTPEHFEMVSWLIRSSVSLEGKLNYVNMDLPSLSLRDEFLLHHPRKFLGQLMRRGKARLIVVFITISGILEDDSWYNLRVQVNHDGDVSHFTFGDEDVENIIQVSCKDLLTSLEGDGANTYPAIFHHLPEIVRMFLREEFFGADRRTRTTIARFLGKEGDDEHFNNCEGSSHASALPGGYYSLHIKKQNTSHALPISNSTPYKRRILTNVTNTPCSSRRRVDKMVPWTLDTSQTSTTHAGQQHVYPVRWNDENADPNVTNLGSTLQPSESSRTEKRVERTDYQQCEDEVLGRMQEYWMHLSSLI
ncbi:hypothetical protein SESBI_05678 [Sesbania bispinosa]|nr:hypothetical protein SESBI_05678 [Sesbania bispinosa]